MTRRAVAVLVAIGALLGTASASAAPQKLRIATLAPKNSAWGKVFKVWAKAIDKKTDGKLQLDVYYNAVQGNEDSMVGKMKTGQLDGAALTSVGLSRIYRDVLVLQLPGVVDSWHVLDKVRASLQTDIEKGFTDQGFTVLGWGDIGLVRQMSKGFAVRRPNDMKGKHPVVWRNEPMGPTIYATIGGVVPVPLSPPEILPALRSGKIDVVNAPALAAEQLQWTPYLDHVSSTVSVCAIGGTVVRRKALDDLPADVKEAFFAIQQKMQKNNTNRVRKLDDEAYKRISNKMKIVEMTPADRAEWEKVLRESVKRLGQGTFDRALIDRVLKITGKGAYPAVARGG
jgi:TRAP-type C4-dicarboxylate transport system substrate-binding protein